ncbi:MAG TPA: hypothetical protein VFB04_04595 [Terriglobales bacterium]|nr:hypothetical protein [Terriglobales bacterium]
MNWPRAHWFVGLSALIIFLVSGLYMLKLAAAPTLDSVPRLVFRSPGI